MTVKLEVYYFVSGCGGQSRYDIHLNQIQTLRISQAHIILLFKLCSTTYISLNFDIFRGVHHKRDSSLNASLCPGFASVLQSPKFCDWFLPILKVDIL